MTHFYRVIVIYIRKRHTHHVYTSILYGSIDNILLKTFY